MFTLYTDAQEETVGLAGEENLTRVVEVTQAEVGVGVMDYLERALRKVFWTTAGTQQELINISL